MFDSPFLYLFACTVKNRVLRRLRRLREPRYLAGAVVGAAYLYLMFFRRMHGRRPPGPEGGFALPAEAIASLQLAGAYVLWLVLLARWVIPVSMQPLKLSGAERDFLKAAPVARRRITRYKLLRSQVAVFLSTVLMLVVAWAAVNSPWSFLLGAFLLFTTMGLHLLGVALTRAGGRPRGGRRDPAAMIAIAVVALSTIGALSAILPGVSELARTDNLNVAVLAIREASLEPVAAVGLMPFTLLVKPVLATWPAGFVVAAWPVVLLALLNYAWVIRADGLLEESAVSSEQEIAEGRRPAARPVNRRAPFALAARGAPEWALVWKNLIMLGRHANAALLWRVGLPLIVLSLIAATSRRPQFVTAALPLAIGLSCGLTLIGPYSFRNDLRQDAGRLSVLKTWPISGERLLWGEIIAPWIVLTAAVWVFILMTGVLALGMPATGLGWSQRLPIGVSAFILFPAVILGQVVVQNAVVVLFPGWAVTGPSRPRGVEAMGQQMLMFAGTMLLLGLGILPGALVGGLLVLLAWSWLGWFAVVPAAVIATALLLAEAIVAVHLLARVLDRTDPSAVEEGR